MRLESDAAQKWYHVVASPKPGIRRYLGRALGLAAGDAQVLYLCSPRARTDGLRPSLMA
jgi:hypothetical protein